MTSPKGSRWRWPRPNATATKAPPNRTRLTRVDAGQDVGERDVAPRSRMSFEQH